MYKQIMALRTKEEIMREYGMLAYVPEDDCQDCDVGCVGAPSGPWGGRGEPGSSGVGGEKELFAARVQCRRGLFDYPLTV
jgi:hypothetical protein